jgi:hypothetical protein
VALGWVFLQVLWFSSITESFHQYSISFIDLSPTLYDQQMPASLNNTLNKKTNCIYIPSVAVEWSDDVNPSLGLEAS